MIEGGRAKWRLSRAVRFWLDARATPSRILRGRERGEDVLFVTLLAFSYFLAHWEEVVSASPLEIVVYPLQSLPADWVPWGWSLTVVVLLLNSWWLDRWLARESGVEEDLRPVWRWLRRIVGGLPILGFLLIPIWRWLIEKQPEWAFIKRPEERFTFLEGMPRHSSTLGRFQRWLDRQHARISPVFVFSFWLFLLNSAILRFLVLGLSRERWSGLRFGFLASIIGLRCIGLGLYSGYLWLWYRNRGRSLKQVLWQLPLSIGWFQPFRMAYFQALLGIALQDWSRRRLMLFQTPGSRPFSSDGQDLRKVGLGWKWFMGQLRFDELDRPYRYRSSVTRLLSFALIFEGGLTLFCLEKVEVRFPSMSLLLAIPFVAVLLWVNLRGLWGLIKVFAGIVRFLRTGASAPEQDLVERSRLLSLLTILSAFSFEGALKDEGTKKGVDVFLTFTPWALSLVLLFFIYLVISMARLRQIDPHGVRWIISFSLLSALGHSMQEKNHPGAPLVVWFLALAIPFLSHMLAVRRVVWMVHPFRLSDVLRSALPPRVRLRLIALVATVVLPLGGLALPAALRARARLKAEFDKVWPFETVEGAQ